MKMFKVLLLAILMALPLPLLAQTPEPSRCGPAEAMLTYLNRAFNERQILDGLNNAGERMVLLAGPQGTYTIVRISPQGIGCLMDAGENLNVLPLRAPGEAS